MSEKLTVADFFCGAGGISEGFRQKGFDVVFAMDYWEPAVNTHKKNHPEAEHVQMDIKELEADEIDEVVPDVDVIVGGPPCQNFSRSNKAGKADKSEGLHLIHHFLRIVAWKMEHGNLKYWAMENVPPTANHLKDEYTWEELQLPGDGADLEIEKKPVHHAVDYGAPQSRRRMIAGNYPELEKRRDEGDYRTVRDVFEKLGDPLRPEDAPKVIQDPNWDIEVDKEDLTDHFYDTRVEEYRWKRAQRLKEDHGYMGKMSFPEDINRPSRTVMATRSASTREAMIFGAEKAENGGWDSYRLPTVREIASFSAYPLTYQFEASTESKKYRLVGNSVPVKLSSAIAESIAKEEGMEIPEEVPPLPNEAPETDLTGKERDFREPGERRWDSKFNRHVPYLKQRALRPSLTNKNSDFEEDEIRWEPILFNGTGNDIDEITVNRDTVKELIKRGNSGQVGLHNFGKDFKVEERLESLEEDLYDKFENSIPSDPIEFHEIYTRKKESEHYNPHEALERCKELIDKHFPEREFDEVDLDNSDNLLEIKKDEIPLRIAAGYFSCRVLADIIHRKNSLSEKKEAEKVTP